jgi:hypothetical protein
MAMQIHHLETSLRETSDKLKDTKDDFQKLNCELVKLQVILLYNYWWQYYFIITGGNILKTILV